MDSCKMILNEKSKYEKQLQLVEEKKKILTRKEQSIISMKDKIRKLKDELTTFEKKKEPSTFFIESSMEEQDQIRKALSRDKYNETLKTKFENIQLDIKQNFRQEQEIYEKMEDIYSQIIEMNKKLEEQFDFVIALKEDIDVQKKKLFQQNKFLIQH